MGDRGIAGENDLKHALLSTCGPIRMTAKAEDHLGRAYGLTSDGLTDP